MTSTMCRKAYNRDIMPFEPWWACVNCILLFAGLAEIGFGEADERYNKNQDAVEAAQALIAKAEGRS